MPNFIGSVFMERDPAGWTENYFLQVADYTTCIGLVQQMNTLRMALALPDVLARALRVSNVEIFRDSQLATLTTPAGTYVGTGTPHTSFPELCLRLRCEASPGKRSSRFLHCIPSDNIVGDAYTPTAGFTTALNAFKNNFIPGFYMASRTGSRAVPPIYTFTALTAVIPTFLTTRRVGRPINLYRGRRRIR